MSIFNVSTTAQLEQALSSAKAGDTIELAAGTYSGASFDNLNFSSNVTITSASSSSPATLTGFYVQNSTGLTFSNLTFSAVGADPQPFRVYSSNNINFTGLEVTGAAGTHGAGQNNGISVYSSSNVSITNSEFQQLGNAMSVIGSNGVTISGNNVHDIESDGIDNSANTNETISNNTFTNFYPVAGDHPDAIQFWTAGSTTSSQNITIENNTISRGVGQAFQGIFMSDEVGTLPYINVNISGNTVLGGMYNGIFVQDGKQVSVTNNSVIGYTDMASWISVLDASTVALTGNQANQINTTSVTGLTQSGDSVVAQQDLTPSQVTQTASTTTATTTVSTTTTAPVTVTAPSGLSLDTSADSGVKGDNITNVGKVVIDGTGPAGDTITLYDGSTVVGTAVANSSGAFQVTVSSALASGTHSLTATATDGSGNVSAASGALSVVVDNTPPAAPTGLSLDASSQSVAGSATTNVATVKIDGTAAAGATVTLYDGTTVVGTAVANSSGAFQITVSSALANGTHSLTATATDVAGNVSAASSALSVVIDTTPPPSPTNLSLDASSESVAGSTTTTIGAVKIDGTAAAGDTVKLYDGTTLVGTGVANSSGAFQIQVSSALATGAHSLTATATDAAGNVSAASGALAVTVTAPPSVAPNAPTGLYLDASTDTGIKGDSMTAATVLKIDGVATAGATITLYDGSTVVGTGVANATTGAFSITTSKLANGTHDFTATATNAAGQASGHSAGYNVVVDTLASTADFSTVTGSASAGYTLGGVATNSSQITVYEDGVKLGVVTPVNGTWSFTTGAVTAGVQHSFTIQTTDASGNVTNGASDMIVGAPGLKIIGTWQADHIYAGPGVHTIVGEDGNNTYIFDELADAPWEANQQASTLLTDFTPGHDKLNLTALGHLTFEGYVTSAPTTLAAHEMEAYYSGGYTVLVADVNGSGKPDMMIRLLGTLHVTASDLMLS